MYQFEKIKLIIWDLDNTFWHGTLSEGAVDIPADHLRLLELLTDIGIINSICSKNDFESTSAFLEKQGLSSYFVFPSINWDSKGPRIKQLISDMQLRPANVLFLDDNHSNIGEAQHYCPNIMTGGPEVISQLLKEAYGAEKKDPNHKRLEQYRLLEKRYHAKKEVSSNEEFLYQSNIRVNIGTDCSAEIDRIHDLIIRSNQLNFTKIRTPSDELQKLLSDKTISSAYITVKDNFGDYGIVGFYALKENQLIHFVFSCRILGMGIEQYIYNKLGRPTLDIVGETISNLSDPEIPGWVNQNSAQNKSNQMQIKDLSAHTVLVKGPCDLFQIYPYIANTELFDTDFTYSLPNGLVIESTGHTTNIVESARLTDKQKQLILSEVPFTDIGMYRDDIFRHPYKVVFLSILTDANLGVYRRKETGEKFAFLEYIHPITDPQNWSGLISGKYPTAGFSFTQETLQCFAEKYEFVGRNTPEQVTENLSFIRNHLADSCTMVVMLGGELYYEKNTFEAYNDRHLVHKEINSAIRSWASNYSNVRLMDVNRYLNNQNDFYDHFNHYTKPVYYALASEMGDIVNDVTGEHVRQKAKWKMAQIRLKEALAPMYYKLRKVLKK